MRNLSPTRGVVNASHEPPVKATFHEVIAYAKQICQAQKTRGLTPAVKEALKHARAPLGKGASFDRHLTAMRNGVALSVWLTRHGITKRSARDCCPCVLGTKTRTCEHCRDSHRPRYDYCGLHRDCRCGLSSRLIDHARTWVRDGLRTIFTTEPYMNADAPELGATLVDWSARKCIAVFQHPTEEGFHNPGGCLFLVFMPERDANEYARLEPTAVRIGGAK